MIKAMAKAPNSTAAIIAVAFKKGMNFHFVFVVKNKSGVKTKLENNAVEPLSILHIIKAMMHT